MARRAFLLGGSGQTGRALIPRLQERGWDVIVGSRGERELPPGVEHVAFDRNVPGALEAAIGEGADVVVDFAALEPAHAEQLLALEGRVGSLVVLSSAAVYFPDEDDELRRLPVPIRETAETIAPGATGYEAKKRAIELALLGQDALPATLIRAGAIHGPWSEWAREWHFVKRVLDGRPVIVLAYRGGSRFHTLSVHNLAELIWLAGEHPGRRVLNAGDPEPPTLLEISRAVAANLGHDWVEVLIDEPAGEIGNTVWSTPHPLVLDMTEAEFELGYRPVTTYGRALPETIEWLVDATRDRDWRDVLPRSAELMQGAFDYDGEDVFVRGLVTAG
ncbi:MAG TPA: NAD-dependent epimerase/dehydratase family protein [Gaiellaceae bacterium]|nr:NAD-dependent epimerase/dehydratase family protein [Gaiellaceae bacterium]